MATIQKVSFSLRLLLKKLSVRTAAVNLVSLVSALVDLSQAHNDELKPIDVYAIGFEEMVDLDAKNIMNARFVSLSCSESMVS